MSQTTRRQATAVAVPPVSAVTRLAQMFQDPAIQSTIAAFHAEVLASVTAVEAPSSMSYARPITVAAAFTQFSDPVAAVQASALAATAHMVVSPAIAQPLQNLVAATSVAAARVAGRELVSVATAHHNAVFESSLVASCRLATIDAGFPDVEIKHVGAAIQVFGVAPSGHALATEIRTAAGEATIETEVFGAAPDCAEVLDTFDAALARRGVTLGRADRRDTFGIPLLLPLRQYAAVKSPVRTSVAPPKTGVRRSQPPRNARLKEGHPHGSR